MGKGLLGNSISLWNSFTNNLQYSVKKMTAQKKNLFSLFRVVDEGR